MIHKPKARWSYLIIVPIVGLVMNFAQAADERVKIVELPNASVPDAELGSSRMIHVAYLSGHDVYYVKSTDDGASFSTPMRVNSEQGFAAGALFRGPDLALGKDERVSIGWYNRAYALKRPDNERGFMYSRMNAAQTGFEPERNLNQQPSDDYSLAADANDRVAALWVDDGLYVSQSNDGGRTFTAPALARPEPCECCGTRAVYSAHGDLFYLYRDKKNNDRDMYLGRFGHENNGPLPIKLNTQTWHINACPMSGSFLTRAGGYLLGAWELQGGIYYSRLSQQGVVEAPGDVQVSATGRYPVVLGNAQQILVAWKQGANFKWQLFNLAGLRQGPIHSMRTSQRGRRGAGVALSNGRFLLFP